LCLERLVPPCREAPISLDLPRLETRADAARVLSSLLTDGGQRFYQIGGTDRRQIEPNGPTAAARGYAIEHQPGRRHIASLITKRDGGDSVLRGRCAPLEEVRVTHPLAVVEPVEA
jgi:hypothetical protein